MLALICVRHWTQENSLARALIATRVHIQILLMVRLSVPPLTRRQDLSHDFALPPLLVHLLGDLPCDLLLLLVVVEDTAAILRPSVRSLPVGSRRVVHLVEIFEEGTVGDLVRVENNLECFCICPVVSTDSLQIRGSRECLRPVRPEHTAW